MRESGLPIDLSPALQLACRPVLQRLLGNATYAAYRDRGWLEAPMLRYMAGPHMAGACDDGSGLATAAGERAAGAVPVRWRAAAGK